MRTHVLFNSRLRCFSRTLPRALLLVGLILFSVNCARAVVIPTVPVGNAGNANDPFTGNSHGGVGYDYRIGTTEVTNAQYAEFLNAKAASDPLGLYSNQMGSAPERGGISRSGVSGSFTYAPLPNMGDKPVNHVTWYDSIRFANWLNNGQGNGDTETGAYTLLGGTPTPSNGASITRNPGATWFLPSENEWYKAAYYQPAAQGGDTDDYWLFPTASNTQPTNAHANSAGDISNPGANVANFGGQASWNGTPGNVTTVGSAGPLSQSYYGTYDQGGNVGEWNETSLDGPLRGVRGGSWNINGAGEMLSFKTGLIDGSASGGEGIGFRVASIPEPSTYALAAIGVVALLAVKRRKSLA